MENLHKGSEFSQNVIQLCQKSIFGCINLNIRVPALITFFAYNVHTVNSAGNRSVPQNVD